MRDASPIVGRDTFVAVEDRYRRSRLLLVRAGLRLWSGWPKRVRAVANYIELGAWLRSIGADLPDIVPSRFDVHGAALARVSAESPLYLEFGVWRGTTTRWWVEHLNHPDARFVGFDSFEGLPETWTHTGIGRGHFSTGGEIPTIPDDRVRFVKGWFHVTLPAYELPEHDQLIVVIDSDLYSSARTVLTEIGPYMKPRSLLYFDEFPGDEQRAFAEFLADSGLRVLAVAVSASGHQWLFQVI